MYSCSFAHCQKAEIPHPCRSYGACLGVRGGRCYKHGAPNGAGQAAAVEDACKVQPSSVGAACIRVRSRTARRPKSPIHAAPTELAWASAVVVTINMALLTELDRPPPSKMRVRCSQAP